MTNIFPIPGELAVHSQASQHPAALELPPQAIECFREGMEQLQAGDPGAALAPLAQSIQHAPNFSEAHVFLGLANALTANIYPAMDQLEAAAKLDRDSFAAHYLVAQLSFRLRTPQRGYDAAKRALQCVQTLDQRKMLTQLLREERERERNGIRRPWFNKPFGIPMLLLFGSGFAALVITVITHIH